MSQDSPTDKTEDTQTKDNQTKDHEYSHEELRCPITHEIFLDPVVCEDGFVYERYAIENWFKKRLTSPLTNREIVNTNTFPVFYVKKMIDDILAKDPQLKKEQYKFVATHLDNTKEVDRSIQNRKYRELLRYTQYSLTVLFNNRDYFEDFMMQCTDLSVFKHVLENCNDIVNARCRNDFSILHFVCRHIIDPILRFTLIKMIVEKKVDVNAQTRYKYTALHYLATYSANLNEIKYLIENGADPNITTDKNYKLIDCLCSNLNHPEDAVDIIQYLISTGAKIDPVSMQDYRSHPIYIACANNNATLTVYLLKLVQTITSEFAYYLISAASTNNNYALLKCLIEIDDNLIKAELGVNLLRTSCINNNTEMFKFLMSKGIDLTLDNNDTGYYLVHYASKCHDVEMLQELINKKVDLNVDSVENEKPIHLACRYSTPEVVKLLLSHKVKLDTKDGSLKYPINYLASNLKKNTFDTETVITLLSAIPKEDLLRTIKKRSDE